MRPRLPLRGMAAREHVTLYPMCPRPHEKPGAYFVALDQHPDDPQEEHSLIRWTTQAMEVLDPEAFLLARVSAPALTHPGLADILAGARPGAFIPVVESVRVGRRKAELQRAVSAARRTGLAVALTGHRLQSAEGYDLVVVSPRTSSVFLDPGDLPLYVTGVDTEEDWRWAVQHGAALSQGAAVAAPIKVAPVDLSRLRR